MKDRYTVELWCWSGLPNELYPVTGHLFARGSESLAIGGTRSAPGKLIFGTLTGRTAIAPKTWNHLALVRDGTRVLVYLNGYPDPEILGEAVPDKSQNIFIGGCADREAMFEGKIDEVAIYTRPISAEEINRHHQLAGVATAPWP